VRRYVRGTPKKHYPDGVRIVHNFFPGAQEDPGRDHVAGAGGFRVWVTDEPHHSERRCFCGWLGGREHYGTRATINEKGQTERLIPPGPDVAVNATDEELRAMAQASLRRSNPADAGG
jgi:hypothetical protein